MLGSGFVEQTLITRIDYWHAARSLLHSYELEFWRKPIYMLS
jgi:hypothetical protein